MKKSNTNEKKKEEDYESRKKEALDFLKLLREIRGKQRDWRHYEKDLKTPYVEEYQQTAT